MRGRSETSEVRTLTLQGLSSQVYQGVLGAGQPSAENVQLHLEEKLVPAQIGKSHLYNVQIRYDTYIFQIRNRHILSKSEINTCIVQIRNIHMYCPNQK